MTAGALVSALGLLGLAHVHPRAAYLGWVVLGAGLGASLYDPASPRSGGSFSPRRADRSPS